MTMERGLSMSRARAILVGLLVLGLAACGGGGGGGGLIVVVAQGSVTLTGCTIAADAATCQGTVAWSTTGASAPRLVVGGATVSTAASGSVPVTLGPGVVTVTLLDAATQLDEKSVTGSCALASAWDGARCRVFAVRLTERVPTPFVEDGRAVTLEVVLYRPPGAGPFPLVVFHHGSTGDGDNPALFTQTFTSESVARYFAERGIMVAFPQRRGRGASDGLYDEGFVADRSRYSCAQGPALAGLERALQDADAAYEYLRTRAEVDAARMLASGWSRGGILAVAHASRRPGAFRGAANFVGGWIGEGCGDAVAVNRGTFAAAGTAAGATIWIYAEADTFYSIGHSRANFDAFAASGGRGTFHVYTRAAGLNGHFVHNDAALWATDLDGFLRQGGVLR